MSRIAQIRDPAERETRIGSNHMDAKSPFRQLDGEPRLGNFTIPCRRFYVHMPTCGGLSESLDKRFDLKARIEVQPLLCFPSKFEWSMIYSHRSPSGEIYPQKQAAAE